MAHQIQHKNKKQVIPMVKRTTNEVCFYYISMDILLVCLKINPTAFQYNIKLHVPDLITSFQSLVKSISATELYYGSVFYVVN